MKKIIKILMLLLLIITTIGEVKAETAPGTLTMTHYTVSSTPVSFPATFRAKKTTNGKYAYCSYYAKHPPVTSIPFTRGNAIADNGLKYLLKEGYKASNDTEFFIYQTAIWTYMIDRGLMPEPYYDLTVFRQTVNNSSTSAASKIRTLVANAKQAGNTDTSAPTISINTNNVTFKEENGNLVSSPIIVNTSTGAFNAVLQSGPEGTTIQKGENKITITIPKNSVDNLVTKVSFKVTNEKEVYTAYQYNPSDSSYQTMALAFKETKTSASTGELTLTQKKSIEILKVDEENQPLIGATLQVENENGKIIDSWKTDGNGHTVSGLTEGTYFLSETASPEGYVLNTAKIKFIVNSTGKITDSTGKEITKIRMINEKNSTSIRISKQDITSKEELAGATLVLKDSKGNIIDEWVSGETSHIIEDLTEGTYTLEETIAPKGYVLSTEKITFQIDKKGNLYDENGKSITKVVMYNAPHKEDVPVEDTSSFKTITSSLIGTIIALIGASILVKTSKQKKEDK